MDRGTWQAIYSPWGCKELDMTEQVSLRYLPYPVPQTKCENSKFWEFKTSFFMLWRDMPNWNFYFKNSCIWSVCDNSKSSLLKSLICIISFNPQTYPWGESESESCSVVSDFLWSHGLYSPWNSPGQNTGVGNFSLLQELFPIQWLNPGLLHCRQILCQLSHKASPKILEWVAYPFSRGSSQLRNQTGVSCLAKQILYQLSYEGSPIHLWHR